MEETLSPSIPPQMSQPIPGQLTPEDVERMKQQARELAIAQYMAQRQEPASQPVSQPQIIYLRRNLTIAELLVIFVIATGIVTGIQVGWNFVSQNLPRIEVRIK